MMKVLYTVLFSFAATAGIGYLLLPVLHALKAGASILEIGPRWHEKKSGTPLWAA